MKDLECPYCGHEQDVCHDDGAGYEEDRAHEMECAKCEKNFVFFTQISFNYHARAADCLNGAKHNFPEWRSVWSGSPWQMRRCRDCDREESRKD